MKTRHLLLLPFAWLMLLPVGCSEDGDTVIVEGPPDQGDGPGDGPTTSVEACLGCHGPNGAVPVADIEIVGDAHFLDTDPDGPLTPAGYRDLFIEITSVDVSGSAVVIEFDVTDENAAPVSDIFAGDGRFSIAQLLPPDAPELEGLDITYGVGASPQWMPYLTRTEDPGDVGNGDGSTETQATAERFSSGTFENLMGGSYRYTSSFDPTSVPVMAGDTIRVAIQIDADDIPPVNGWCDFDASLAGPSACGTASMTRDIVQTEVCNGCHGVTPDTQLGLHGGGRTDVEYCVTCHNPFTKDANSDNVVSMTRLIHKIHYGSELSEPFQIWGFRDSLHDYSHVEFTKEINDCANCHTGGGADEGNWHDFPTIGTCTSCHDDVNLSTGENHPVGNLDDNTLCSACHPSDSPGAAPIQVVHTGAARRAEANLYTGGDNGFDIVSVDADDGDLTIEYQVTKDGIPMDLDNDAEWTAPGGASRLAITVGWSTTDYTNEGTPSAPASALSVNGLDVGGAVTALPGNVYSTTVSLPSEAGNTVTVSMEGHPAAEILPGSFERIPVINVFEHVNIESRGSAMPRRDVVDIGKCNQCHDAAGQGLSLHGNNRTGEDIVCSVCHNPNNTDVNRRPEDPMDTPDGLREQTIDFKRMIHMIHNGAELEDGLYIYGFGGSLHDFSHVEFIGNLQNCETCHMEGTYGALNAAGTPAGDPLPTTIHTGEDLGDPGDDLNISPIASVCSACHDGDPAVEHMELHGAAFSALDEDIH